MKRKWLLFGWFFLFVAAIWLAYHYFFVSPESLPRKAQQAVKASLKDIELVHGQAGKVVWRLKAKSSHMSQKGETIFFQEPRLRYLMESGSGAVQATAAQGRFDRETGQATFWPDVVTHYRGMELTSGRMTYTANKKQLLFSQGVRAKDPEIEISSQRAVFAVSKQVFVFEDQAEVRMYETPKEQ